MSQTGEEGLTPPRQQEQAEDQIQAQVGEMMQAPGAGFSVPLDATTALADQRIEIAGGSNVHVNDVLCGRGKVSFNHSGNKRFRRAITSSLDEYRKACASGSRSDKALIVHRIITGVVNSGGRFLKENQATGEWYPLSEQQTKEKVSHAVRDAANTMDARKAQRATKEKKLDETKQDKLPLDAGLRSSLSSATIGSTNFYENLDRATREIRRHASQQNYVPYAMDSSNMRGLRLGSLAEDRLPIRTVRDIQIPGQQQQLSGIVTGMTGHVPRAVPSLPHPGLGQYAGSLSHTNLVSEPRLGGLSSSLAQRPRMGGSIMMPEGPRLGFADFQSHSVPTQFSSRTAPRRPPVAPQPLDVQPSDDSDNFLDRINDVLGPMPDEGDQT